MNYASYEDVKQIVTGMAKKIPHGVMLGNTTVGHIEWQMYLQRDYLKLDGTPLANASNDYDELLKFAQDNSLITSDTTDKSLFKYDSTNDVLTLPDYIGLCLQGGNTIEEKEAGLPNIKGSASLGISIGVNLNAFGMINPTGAIGGATSAPLAKFTSSGSGSSFENTSNFNIDASRSSSIYSDSVNTVQPPAITLIPQIKYKKSTVHEGIDLNKLMPLGTVINFMGTTAPDYYLACDGTVYNINNYTILANFFEEQFGSVNYFGGDGTITFAVPDLRGEFLRGTGTNSHINQGSGDNVGTHQDGTDHTALYINPSNKTLQALGRAGGEAIYYNTNRDGSGTGGSSTNVTDFSFSGKISGTIGSNADKTFTSRPTNTSVLYCIKYK